MKDALKKIKQVFRLPNRRYEAVDPRPMAIPVGMERPESLMEKIKRLVHDQNFQASLQADGLETFEESNDFEPEDEMPRTPYEEGHDPHGVIAREHAIRAGVVEDPKDRLEKAEQLLAKAKADVLAAKKKRAEDKI